MRLINGSVMLLRSGGQAQFGTGGRNGFLVKGLSPVHIAILKWLFEKQSWYNSHLERRFPENKQEIKDILQILKDGGLAAKHQVPDGDCACAYHLYGSDSAIKSRDQALVGVSGLGPLGITLTSKLVACGIHSLILRDQSKVKTRDLCVYKDDYLGAMRQDVAPLVLGVNKQLPNKAVTIEVAISSYLTNPAWAKACINRGVPHLPIIKRETEIEVGPLFIPGTTCCLHCQHLAKRDADPEWPRIAAQLACAGPVMVDTALAEYASAFAVREILNYLSGLPLSLAGASWIFNLTDPLPQVRQWQPHPQCGCVRD
ncbi:MAG: hypothetical protein KIB42_01860 [Varibaculum cambriense]|uniref:hypothetical protein n=1 Tax=Varibaculum cambriense TaxID=184870 RepID=UPI001EBB77CF|nr:hypothetical protein [Varibaculum cambriense]MBS5918358.1 hypothetical protein [Varibaculum cambriense]